jgi:HEAT repeat protein
MSKTFEELRSQLSAIEPNDGTYAGIGPSDIPLLSQLLQDKEQWMASRAVFALSRIPDPSATAILSRTAADPRPEVRVAVAASTSNLDPGDANGILLRLLGDTELGVRKFAVLAVSEGHDAAVHAMLRDIETRDPANAIRSIAKDQVQKLAH